MVCHSLLLSLCVCDLLIIGGWSFLEDKGSDDEVPDSESESDFEPESSAEEEEESDEVRFIDHKWLNEWLTDHVQEYESDDSEGSASDDSGSDDDDEDEEDEEGEDWEELERKAAAGLSHSSW